MSIEAMKQALEALNYLQGLVDTERGPKAAAALRQAIDAYTLSSKPPGLCMCGEPWRLESVHRKKSPCFDYIQREWVGLTLEDKKEYLSQDFGGSRADAMDWAEQRLKEKNA